MEVIWIYYILFFIIFIFLSPGWCETWSRIWHLLYWWTSAVSQLPYVLHSDKAARICISSSSFLIVTARLINNKVHLHN